MKLKTKDGNYFSKGVADFEGIALFGNDILVSNEGAINRVIPNPPELYRFNRQGKFIQLLPIPEKFLLPKKDHLDKLYGSRDNKSFESLSTSLDGTTTFMATEESLLLNKGVTRRFK